MQWLGALREGRKSVIRKRVGSGLGGDYVSFRSCQLAEAPTQDRNKDISCLG